MGDSITKLKKIQLLINAALALGITIYFILLTVAWTIVFQLD